MVVNLLAEIFGGARRLTGAILALIVSIYISGFVIVTLYLWKFGIARIEPLQPMIIATGLSYLLFGAGAVLAALMTVSVTSSLLEAADEIWATRFDNKKRSSSLFWTWLRGHDSKFLNSEWVYLALAVIVFAGSIHLSGWIASWAIAVLFGFGSRAGISDELTQILQASLEPIIRIYGVSVALVLLLFNCRNKLGTSLRLIATSIITAIFLFAQVYALLKIADRQVYDNLPISFGGGQLIKVRFLVEEDEVRLLEAMGVPMVDSPVETAMLPQGDSGLIAGKASCKLKDTEVACTLNLSGDTNSRLFLTEPVSLIWLLSGDNSLTYTIEVPCKENPCSRAATFDKALVVGLLYLSPRK